VFVIHYHGGAHRPFGHPHAHALLSPRLQDGAALQYIPRPRLARIKERWEPEITQAVTRFERCALTRFAQHVPLPELAPAREVRRGRFGERLLEMASDPAALFKRVAPRPAETVAPAPLRCTLRAARLWGRLTSRGNPGGSDE
jgi:hypothetical protein